MTRAQLYLPDEVYAQIKLEAKNKSMSFAGYVRMHFESFGIGKKKEEKTLDERLPFLKHAGAFHLGVSASQQVDSIYDF